MLGNLLQKGKLEPASYSAYINMNTKLKNYIHIAPHSPDGPMKKIYTHPSHSDNSYPNTGDSIH